MSPRKRQRPNPGDVNVSLASTATSRSAMVRPVPAFMATTKSRSQSVSNKSSATTTTTTTIAAAAAAVLDARQLASFPPPPPIPPMPPADPRSAALTVPSGQKQLRKAKSWYGQWPKTPKKASASTSVARENILGGTVRSKASPGLGRFDPSKRTSADALDDHFKPKTSKVPENGGTKTASGPKTTNDKGPDEGTDGAMKQHSTENQTDNKLEDSKIAQDISSPAGTPVGWLGGWWSSKAPPTTEQQNTSTTARLGGPTKAVPEIRPFTPPHQTAPENPPPREPPPSAPAPSSTWFGFWSSIPGNDMKKPEPEPEKNAKPKEEDDVFMQDAPTSDPTVSSAPGTQTTPKAGSTWAFWSRESPSQGGGKNPAASESGEMAVIGEGSEAQPKRMTENDVSGPRGKGSKQGTQSKDTQALGKSTWRKKKRVRPPSLEAAAEAEAGASVPEPPSLSVPHKESRPTTPSMRIESSSNSIAESETASKQPPNLLLPSFASTYRMKDNPSILQQITQLLLRTSQPPANHVFRVKETPKIRKAIAIGVHGLFPATYLRPMIGQPTGTSLRFANLCAEGIRRWTDAHGSPDCEIEKVALEGEGRISDRVDNLWKLMLNWIDHIRKADLIILACHSQGVPVSIMLLDKLIDLGIITNAKIGVCAMAGVALGPFPDYKSSILMGSAAELWDFGNPQSALSRRFEMSLNRVLAYGARVTFIGSIDDQLVPMESAVYSPASHPYIYRAVFIDGRVHAPDFIAHLVGLALKLRNLGVKDHGLIRELSVALAGSLYSGEGHSRLYYDPAVYDLAISHALETTSTRTPVPCEIGPREGLASANPYVLPWIMRGMLEEDFVRTELSSETEELLRQFDDWKPSNKALKDVKYRLEAVRSKL